MTHNIVLTTDQLAVLCAALNVVTPSGGGSCSRSLSSKIAASFEDAAVQAEFDQRVSLLHDTFLRNVMNEYVEAVGDNHPELAQLVTEQMREWPSSSVDV